MDMCDLCMMIFMPPLAVFRRYGCGKETLLCFALTLAGYVPGLIYAKIILDAQAEKQPLLKGKGFDSFDSMVTRDALRNCKPDVEAPIQPVVETQVPEAVEVGSLVAQGQSVKESVKDVKAARAALPVVVHRSPLPKTPSTCEALSHKAAEVENTRKSSTDVVRQESRGTSRERSGPRQRSSSMRARLEKMQSMLDEDAPTLLELKGDASTSVYQATCGLCHGTGKSSVGLPCACVEAEDPAIPDAKISKAQIEEAVAAAKAKASEAESLSWLASVSKGGEDEEKTMLAAEDMEKEAAALTIEAERLKVIAKKQTNAVPLVTNLPTGLSAEEMLVVMRERWAKLEEAGNQ